MQQRIKMPGVVMGSGIAAPCLGVHGIVPKALDGRAPGPTFAP
jgi:hypothetical protein